MIAWIKTIEPEDASGLLRELYEQVTTPHGTVDNVMKSAQFAPAHDGGPPGAISQRSA